MDVCKNFCNHVVRFKICSCIMILMYLCTYLHLHWYVVIFLVPCSLTLVIIMALPTSGK